MAQGDWFWHELHTPDAEGAKSFYGAIAGWGTETMPMPQGDYFLWQHGKDSHGGMVHSAAMPEGERLPTGWYVYINVDDVDASAAKVVELGGKLLVPPYDLENIGRMTLIEDPQGAKAFLMRGAHQED